MNDSLLQINSPQSAIVGIFLILGIYTFGKFLWKKFIFINLKYEFCQYALFGLIIISFILYPVFLFDFYSLIISKFIAYALLTFGFIEFLFFLKNIGNSKIYLNTISKEYYIFILLLLGYVLISLSPATNADSLDYHYGIASFIRSYGYYPVSTEITWIHGILGGIFESTISLGLNVGSDSFGSLLQFVALLSIIGTIIGVKKKSKFIKQEIFYIFICILAITPLVFLFSSAKPQLIGVASNLFAINLIFLFNKINFSKNETNIFLILLLLVFSYLVKFTFVISCFLIFIYLFYKCYKLNKLKKLFSFSFLIFLFLIIPVWYWKIINLNFSFVEILFSPLPVSKGSFSSFLDYMVLHNEFNHTLGFKEYRDKIIFLKIFPIFLIFPSDLSRITTFIGVPLILLFLYKKNKRIEVQELKFFILLLYILIAVFSSPNSRYYLLVYYLGIYHLAIVGIDFKSKLFNLISKLIKIQLIFVLIIVFYGIYILSPGIINNKYRSVVLNNHAIYYNVSKFTEKKLIEKTRIINDFRSTALFKFPQVRTDWININAIDYNKIENREKFNHHLEKIIKFNPEYLITSENSKTYFHLKSCLILQHSKDNVKKVKRNPFGENRYINVRIYKINGLEKCLKK